MCFGYGSFDYSVCTLCWREGGMHENLKHKNYYQTERNSERGVSYVSSVSRLIFLFIAKQPDTARSRIGAGPCDGRVQDPVQASECIQGELGKVLSAFAVSNLRTYHDAISVIPIPELDLHCCRNIKSVLWYYLFRKREVIQSLDSPGTFLGGMNLVVVL